MIYKKIILGFLLTVIALNANSQYYSYKQHVDYADKSFVSGNYLEAMTHYKKALEQSDKLSDGALRNYADAAYNTYSLNLAEQLYSQYLELDETESPQDVRYRLAEIKMLKGDYENAITDFDLYLSEYAEVDTNLTNEVNFLKESAEWASTQNIEYQYRPAESVDSVNSPFSEHAPFLVEDDLYYNSLKFPIEGEELNSFNSKILKNSNVVDVLGLTSNQILSHPSFSPDGKYLFFTVGEYTDLATIRCDIYYAPVNEQGGLGTSKRLPDFINRAGYTSTHPSVSTLPDSSLVLLYVTDKAGGKGGMDIWYSNIDGDMEFGVPQNLLQANTAKDDLSPFHHEETNTLYFSTNGRLGFGGFDIYKTDYNGFVSGEVQNLGDNINSPNNDLYFFLTEDESASYFSSNRPGSQYLESKFETCCYDIYKAPAKPCVIELDLATYNQENSAFLDGASITISDKETGDIIYKGVSSDTISTIELPCNDNMELKASKPGFEDAILDLSDLEGVPGQDNKASREVFLKPLDYSLSLKVVEEGTMDPIAGATVYLTEIGTDGVVERTNVTDNLFNFEIKPNTKYLLEINKEGYKEYAGEFTTGTDETVVEKIVELKLLDVVEKALISLADAIPVSMYFDNDKPEQGSIESTSAKNYTQTYREYYPRKDKFKNIYITKFSGEDKFIANEDVESLFENDIKGGYNKYERFKTQLLLVLENGQEANIYLRGFASPVAGNEYNIALGRRRIDSVRKEFYQWKGGVLVQYINSEQLKITERSFGEDSSPAGISDNVNAPDKSIYSPEASRERRVEIDEIQFNQN